jgi:hypothetical protein
VDATVVTHALPSHTCKALVDKTPNPHTHTPLVVAKPAPAPSSKPTLLLMMQTAQLTSLTALNPVCNHSCNRLAHPQYALMPLHGHHTLVVS